MEMDYQEGYCDGIAGAGMQDRVEDTMSDDSYWNGHEAGALDRKRLAKWSDEA